MNQEPFLNLDAYDEVTYFVLKRDLELKKDGSMMQFLSFMTEHLITRVGTDRTHFYFYNIPKQKLPIFFQETKQLSSTELFAVKNFYMDHENFQVQDISVFASDLKLLLTLRMPEIIKDPYETHQGSSTFQKRKNKQSKSPLQIPNCLKCVIVPTSNVKNIAKLKILLNKSPFSFLRILSSPNAELLLSVFEPPYAPSFVEDHIGLNADVEYYQLGGFK